MSKVFARVAPCAVSMFVAIALVSCNSNAALAVSFSTSGGSYTANVAYRIDSSGTLLSSVAGALTNTGVQGGSVNNTLDYKFTPWQLTSMPDGNSQAKITVTLDQSYLLNKIRTSYNDFRPAQYQLRVSPDNSSWTTVVSPAAVTGNLHNNSFADINAKYLEWTIYGPATNLSGSTYAYPQEIMAFVSSASSSAPQLEGGYNVLSNATIFSQTGTSLAQVFDNNLSSYSIPGAGGATTIFDLGAAIRLYRIGMDFYPGQTWTTGSVEISKDQLIWDTIVNTSNLGSSTYSFAPNEARYIRLSGTGNGALVEFTAFALPAIPPVPEPSSLVLLSLGGLLFTRRKQGK